MTWPRIAVICSFKEEGADVYLRTILSELHTKQNKNKIDFFNLRFGQVYKLPSLLIIFF